MKFKPPAALAFVVGGVVLTRNRQEEREKMKRRGREREEEREEFLLRDLC
jgi:hypothetical protein